MTNKLPIGWIECNIGDISEIVTGKTPSKKQTEYFGGSVPFVKPGDLDKSKYIIKSEDTLTKLGFQYAPFLPAGSVLVSCIGNLGKKGILQIDGSCNQQINAILPNEYVDNLYLYYYIDKIKNWMEANASATTVTILNKQNFSKAPLLLPPLAEQGRIVEKIEEIFAKIDAGVEKLKSAQEKIKQYKQSVLHSAFTGKLEKVSNWKHEFLKEICNKITDGSHFSPESDNSYDYPYITVKDIFNDNIMFSSAKKIKKIDYEKLVYNGCKPNIGDVLFSKDGTVGKVSLIQSNINFVVLSSLAILTPNYDKITSKFLFYMLKSPEFLSEALKNKTGVAIRRIILATLKNIKVFYPSDISEQERIVEEIEKRFAKADKMLEVVEKSLKSAEQLKQSVLKKAFEGKLVPQNPNDEPASVLLERIKSEKQQNEKVKGKRK